MNYLNDVYTNIWIILEEQPEIAELVKKNNRIKYDPLREKWNTLTQDYTMIRILPTIIGANMHASSCSSRLTMAYDIQILSGKVAIEKIFEVFFAVFKGCQDMQEKLSGRVSWAEDGSTPIARAEIINGGFGKDTGISVASGGWHTMARLEVDMFFSSTTLQSG
jgi:hypothetical protein